MKKNKAKQPGNNAQQASKTHTTPIQSQGNSDFSFSRNQWLILAVLILATVISYWPTLNNGFVNWDDDLYVTENPFINTDVPGNFNKLMNANVAANRHPATMATLALDYKLTGEKDGAFTSAKIYHAQSLVWHLANIFLVFWLVFMLSSSNFFIAIFGAAVFALHPMHVESVAWVSGRKDVVYTFFFLLSCIAYLSNMKQAKTWKYVAALALFTISLAAKPAAVILPVLLVLFDFFFNYQASKTTLAKWVLNTKTWINKIPFFALALLAGIITFKSQGETEALEGKKFFDLADKIQFGTYSFINYIYKFFLPVKLSSFHPYPIDLQGNLPAWYWLFLLLTTAVLGLAFYSLKHSKIIFFGIGFYFITIALVLQFITVGSAITAERYTYVPYIGLAYIVGYYLYQMINVGGKWHSMQKPIFGVLTVLFLAMGYLTHARTQVWHDSTTLWDNVVEQYKKDSGTYNNRGHAYRSKSDKFEINSAQWNACLDSALVNYQKAIDLKPDNSKAYSNMGMVYFKRNQDDKAMEVYTKSLALDPTYYEAWSNRGAINSRNGRLTDGLYDLNKCLELNPTHIQGIINRAITYTQLGNVTINQYNTPIAGRTQEETNNLQSQAKRYYTSSINDFKIVLNAKPNDPSILNSIAVSYQSMADYNNSLIYFNQALTIAPQASDIYLNRAISYYFLKNKNAALNDLNKAVANGFKIDARYQELQNRINSL